MTIPFGCACGKKLQAKDEFAGKKMRCPGCGTVLAIPKPAAPPRVTKTTAPAPPLPRPVTKAPSPPVPPLEVSDAEENLFDVPASPPAPLPGPAIVHFPCDCGRLLKARQQDAGGEIDCPDCGQMLVIPAEDTDEPPRAPAARANPWADGFLSQTSTPWKDEGARQRGADSKEPRDEKAGSWFATALVLLLLAGGGAALWYFMPNIAAYAREQGQTFKNLPNAPLPPVPDLDRIPGNAVAFLAIRPADLPQPQADARGQYNGLAALAKVFSESFAGLAPAQIERLTLVMLWPEWSKEEQDRKGPERWIVVRTKAPLVRKYLLERLIPSAVQHAYKGQTYFASGKGPRAPGTAEPALHFLDSHLFVLGETDTIKRFLERAPRQLVRGPLADAIQLAREKRPLVIGLNQSSFRLRPRARALPAELLDFQSGAVTVEEPRDVLLDVRLTYANPRTAAVAEGSVRRWSRLVASVLKQQQSLLDRWRFNRMEGPICCTLGSLTPSPISPLGPLHVVPALPHPQASPPEIDVAKSLAVEALRLRAQRAEVAGSSVHLTLRAEQSRAEPASWIWGPYVRLVTDSVPDFRRLPVIPKGPKGGR